MKLSVCYQCYNNILTYATGVLTLTEPLEHDHLIHTFLDPSDLQQVDPPPMTGSGGTPWWGDGGSMAPEVGMLTHNIVIQGAVGRVPVTHSLAMVDPWAPKQEHSLLYKVQCGEC